jgi:hypothetical protein
LRHLPWSSSTPHCKMCSHKTLEQRPSQMLAQWRRKNRQPRRCYAVRKLAKTHRLYRKGPRPQTRVFWL